MAVCTHAVATASTSNVTSYASGSFTPAAGDLLVAFVFATGTAATGTMTDSQSLGFTKYNSWPVSSSTIYVFVANALAAASSMTVTFDCTGDAATGAIIFVTRVSGMSKLATAAVVQAGTNSGTSGVTPSATFSAAADTTNPTIAYITNLSNPAGMTAPTNWAEQADTGYATPTTGAEYGTRDSGFTGTVITWGGNSATAWGTVTIELNAHSLPPMPDLMRSHQAILAM